MATARVPLLDLTGHLPESYAPPSVALDAATATTKAGEALASKNAAAQSETDAGLAKTAAESARDLARDYRDAASGHAGTATAGAQAATTKAAEALSSANSAAAYATSGVRVHVDNMGGATDRDKLIAALTTASAAAGGGIVMLPDRIIDVGNGLSMAGYHCSIEGSGASADNVSYSPARSTIYASTQTGPVLDFTAFRPPTSLNGRISIGGFAVRGSGLADPTKANAGMKFSDTSLANAQGGLYVHDVSIFDTGGPDLWLGNVYLSAFDRITLGSPRGSQTNDVPFLLMEATNGVTFNGLGLRKMFGEVLGASGAVVIKAAGGYNCENDTFSQTWCENIWIPTNGTVFDVTGYTHVIRDTYFVDSETVAGSTGTSAFRLKGVGCTVKGWIPGNMFASSGVEISGNGNRVEGIKGWAQDNVLLMSGAEHNYIDLGGTLSGTGEGVVDNSGNLTNSIRDSYDQQAGPTATRKPYAAQGDGYFDTTVGRPVYLKTKGVRQVDTITVTAGASTSGTVTVTIDGTPKTAAVVAGDTAAQVAAKIRAGMWAGWTTVVGAVVTNTYNTRGPKVTSFADGGTGVTVTIATTRAGVADVWVDARGVDPAVVTDVSALSSGAAPSGNVATANGSGGVAWAAGGGGAAQVDTYEATGGAGTQTTYTWTKPLGAKSVAVTLISGGGGGGSGRRGAAGTIRCGGGGGGPAGRADFVIDAAALAGTVTVKVGKGGAGGAAITADDTSGNVGGNGGNSSFGVLTMAAAAVGGGGGTASTGTAGTGGAGPSTGTATNGAAASTTGATGANGASAATGYLNPTGGASGGGITSADAVSAGGVGGFGNALGVAGGAAGAAGANGSAGSSFIRLGTGGGGGGSSITAAAGSGGAGANYGAGGGGGGASLNGYASGSGGNGGDGIAIIITSF